jgi:2-dehydropantoate 2-reductase
MNNRMNIISIGAGAIGTYVGGSLALQGHQVVFVERPSIVEQIQSRGLRLTIGSKDHHINNPNIVGSIEDALQSGKFDVVIYALKSYDTDRFLSSLPEPLSHHPVFLCLSNGVENETAIAKKLGSSKVIAGTVTSAVGRRDAGDIILERLRGIGISAGNSLSEQLAISMEEAGLNPNLFTNADDMKWSKMLTNLIANASSAILDMTPGEVFSHPGLYKIEISQLRETLDVMGAKGFRVVDLPGTPVKLLAIATKYLPMFASRPLMAKAVGGGRGGKMPSFHIDLHSGKGNSEVEYLNGAVSRAGLEMGIPTPANQILNQVLNDLTNGVIPLETYKGHPEKLIQAFETTK